MFDQIIQQLHSQGFCHIKGVLDLDKLKELQSFFVLDFKPAKIGKTDGPQRVPEVRGDSIHWLDPLNPPQELNGIISFLNELKSKLNQEFFLGLKDFECHLAKYPAGTFYKKHSDRFEKDSSRSVSFIFYLHEEWAEKDGGELVLYNKQNDILQTIYPEPGSMIVFMSEEFPHEVKICHKERRSLTGWMHTKILN